MPHIVTVGGHSRVVGDAVDVGLLRAHALASGALAVLTPGDATRDGAPVIGGVSVVPWGAAAIFRAAGERVTVAFEARSQHIPAPVGRDCRLCLGGFDTEQDARAIACSCGVPFHLECHALTVTCPECSRPRGDASW